MEGFIELGGANNGKNCHQINFLFNYVIRKLTNFTSMAIELEFINLVVRKSTLETKYQGSTEQFKMDLPNQSLREDDDLIRFGCMNWNDMEHFTDVLVSKGLEYKDQDTTDFVVISALQGALWKVDWIGFNATSCYAISAS